LEFVVVPEVAIPVVAVTPLVVAPVEPVVRLVLKRHTVSVMVVVVAAVGAGVAPPIVISAAFVFAGTFVASAAVSLLLEQVARCRRALIEEVVFGLFRLKHKIKPCFDQI
jgi:hypothetical protein